MSTNHFTTNKPKPYKGMAMEGSIAKWYAKNTGGLPSRNVCSKKSRPSCPQVETSLKLHRPGFYQLSLHVLGSYKVTALEISKTFIEIAQDNARKASVDVDFRHGNASDMPFEDNTLISSSVCSIQEFLSACGSDP